MTFKFCGILYIGFMVVVVVRGFHGGGGGFHCEFAVVAVDFGKGFAIFLCVFMYM